MICGLRRVLFSGLVEALQDATVFWYLSPPVPGEWPCQPQLGQFECFTTWLYDVHTKLFRGCGGWVACVQIFLVFVQETTMRRENAVSNISLDYTSGQNGRKIAGLRSRRLKK